MIITKILKSVFEGGDAYIKFKLLDNGHKGKATGFMVSCDVKDNLAFMTIG